MSDIEMKKQVDDLGRTWEQMKAALDQREAEVKRLGTESAETKATIEKQNTAIDNAEKAIQAIQTAAARPPMTEQKALAVVEEKKAFLAFALTGRSGEVKSFHPREQKVLSVGDATTGGIFAMPEILSGLLRAVVEISPFRQYATVRQTSRESVQLRKETTVGSYGWTGEQTTRTETTNPKYGWEIVPVHEIYAMIDITRWDLEDTDFNWEQELSYQATTQFAKAEGAAFHSGNGVGKPFGFIGLPATVTLGNDTFTGDNLIEMEAALKSAYRTNARWFMNRVTMGMCRKLKGSTNDHYLWEPGLNGPQAPTLLGYPVIEAVDMVDGNGSVVKPIAFGDFRAHYTVVDRLDMSVQRDDFTQAATGAVRFWFRRRVGGQAVNLEAMKVGVTT